MVKFSLFLFQSFWTSMMMKSLKMTKIICRVLKILVFLRTVDGLPVPGMHTIQLGLFLSEVQYACVAFSFKKCRICMSKLFFKNFSSVGRYIYLVFPFFSFNFLTAFCLFQVELKNLVCDSSWEYITQCWPSFLFFFFQLESPYLFLCEDIYISVLSLSVTVSNND